MLKLVNYENSSDEESEEAVRQLVSTMAVEGVPFKPTHDSDEITLGKLQEAGCSNKQAVQAPIGPPNDGNVLGKLQEYGCSYEQAVQALSVCGSSASIIDLFDYIQACTCNLVNEGHERGLDLQGHQEKQLNDMGYTQLHIENALEACGKQSSVLELVDFIQAHYCIEEASCSEKVAEIDPIGLNDQSPSKELQAMGCSYEAIAKAINACGENAHVSDLFDFIQAFQCLNGDEGCALHAPVLKENVLVEEAGISQRRRPDASGDCDESSISAFNLSYNCNENKEEVADVADEGGKQTDMDELEPKGLEELSNVINPTEETARQHNETICTSVDESCLVGADRYLIRSNSESSGSSFKQLQEMGCSCEDIAKAISVCGETTQVSDLFDFIQAFHYTIAYEGFVSHIPAFQEDVSLNETGFIQVHRTDDSGVCVAGSAFDRKELSEAYLGNKNEDDIADLVGHEKKTNHIANEPPPKVLKNLSANTNSTKKNKVAERDFIELNRNESSIERLQDMGCSNEDIAIAISVCGEDAPVLDLFDFIQASLVPAEEKGAVSNVPAFEEDVPPDEMGFKYGHIPDAFGACVNESLDADVLDFIQAHFDYGNERKHSSGNPLTFATNVAGPSKKSMAKRLKRAKIPTKAWSSVLKQEKKGMGAFDSEEIERNSFESGEKDHDFLESFWEGFEDEKMDNLKHQCSSLQHERMMGFGLPGQLNSRPRPLPHCMQGPPFFYFENVANVIDNSWNTIKLHFNGVEPEFVDSRFFSATRRQRGYVHNLPVHSRKLVLPQPSMTILEAFPHLQEYWPCWDTREKMNCITTKGPMLKLCNLIRSTLSDFEGMDVPDEVQQMILRECKRHNLLWVGPNELASLDVREIEKLLGFDDDHTRGCSSMTDRYEMLGNSFQINTVAYHMSPLQSLFPKGITMLSLFTGIGGAEVALHKLGIFLKRVVVVEKVEKTRDIFFGWWKKSGQKGDLICKYHDVKELTYEVLTELVDEVGKIDLIVGGSPCNNLTGSNRWSRNGLNGTESSLFFEFPRILNSVKKIMEVGSYIL